MKLRRPRPASVALGASVGAQPHALTSPTNQTSLLVPSESRVGAPIPRTPPASPFELDAQVAAFRHEVHFSSATPVSQWIRLADRLKRQADQHHNAGDLERQYLWYVRRSLFSLAKCAKILDELLPNEHSGWSKLDDERRAHVAQVRMARLRRPRRPFAAWFS